jgi:hypothetical protein
MIWEGITLPSGRAPLGRLALGLLAIIGPAGTESQATNTTQETAADATRARVGPGEQAPSGRDANRILLRGRTIDTAQALPEMWLAVEECPAAGHRLQLIQFSGPVRDEWLEDVERQGKVKIVTYVPNNAYLIWADDPSIEKLQQLRKKRTHLQWVGPFPPAFRIAPGLEAMIEEGGKVVAEGEQDLAVTVQLFAHESVGSSIAKVRARSKRIIREAWSTGPYRNLRVVIPRSAVAAIACLPDVVNVEPWIEPSLRPD